MVFSREQSFSVHDAMCRNVFHIMASIHRPTYHSGGTRRSQCLGNGPIGSDFSVRNLSGDDINSFEKIVVFLDHFTNNN